MEVLDLITGIIVSLLVIMNIVFDKRIIKEMSTYGILFTLSITFLNSGNSFIFFISLITFIVMEFVIKTNKSKKVVLAKETKMKLNTIRYIGLILISLFSILFFTKIQSFTGINLENSIKEVHSEKAITGLLIFLIFGFMTLVKVRPWK
jgi:hypothetical protein